MLDGNGAEKTGDLDVSIVIPVLNEAESIAVVYGELDRALRDEEDAYEIIFVDDGSTDRTCDVLCGATAGDPRVSIIQFARRFGQTAALSAGFARARGRIIVPMDGDGQNDPNDIPRLVDDLRRHPECDIVSGWRKQRQDRLVSRRIPSVLANRLIRQLTWTPEVSDFGCSMKAYRREVLADVGLYGEMHRFLPAICKWRGARIRERVVNHRPRVTGESKYDLRRTIKVTLDLLTVKFLGDYLTKPIYFFGKVALLTLAVSLMALIVAVCQKFGYATEHGVPVNLNDNVFVLFAMMTFLMAGMCLMMGVLSELLARIYHESQGRRPYKVRQVINAGEQTTLGRVECVTAPTRIGTEVSKESAYSKRM